VTEEEIRLIISGRNELQRPLSAARQGVRRFADGTIGHFRRIAGSVLNLQNLIIGGAAAVGAKAVFRPAIEMEQAETAFGVLFGDVDLGREKIEELIEFAATTPLRFRGIRAATEELKGARLANEDLIDTMRMLGDIAMGDAEKFSRLVHAYAKLRTKGRATMEELNMFLEAGVPILDELRRRYDDISGPAMAKLIQRGEVGFREVHEALAALTEQGGMFHRMMEKISRTAGGRISTLKDVFELGLTDVGTEAIDELGEVIDDLIESIEELRESGKLEEWGKDTARAIRGTYEALKQLAEFVGENRETLKALGLSYVGARVMTSAVVGMEAMTAAMAAQTGVAAKLAAALGTVGAGISGILIATAIFGGLHARKKMLETNAVHAAAHENALSPMLLGAELWKEKYGSLDATNAQGQDFSAFWREFNATQREGAADAEAAGEEAADAAEGAGTDIADGVQEGNREVAEALQEAARKEIERRRDIAARIEEAKQEFHEAALDADRGRLDERIKALQDEQRKLEAEARALQRQADEAWDRLLLPKAERRELREREENRADREAEVRSELQRAQEKQAEIDRRRERGIELGGPRLSDREKELLAADRLRRQAEQAEAEKRHAEDNEKRLREQRAELDARIARLTETQISTEQELTDALNRLRDELRGDGGSFGGTSLGRLSDSDLEKLYRGAGAILGSGPQDPDAPAQAAMIAEILGRAPSPARRPADTASIYDPRFDLPRYTRLPSEGTRGTSPDVYLPGAAAGGGEVVSLLEAISTNTGYTAEHIRAALGMTA